jgi:hypothetical protein
MRRLVSPEKLGLMRWRSHIIFSILGNGGLSRQRPSRITRKGSEGGLVQVPASRGDPVNGWGGSGGCGLDGNEGLAIEKGKKKCSAWEDEFR